MEQQPRICPLCGAPVRLFYINFTEKVLMCEDVNCDFPFGYEELQIVVDESELRENFDTVSSISLGADINMSAASSVVSTAAWADIEKLNRVYESEDNAAESRMSVTSDAVKKQKERRKTEQEIQENLETLKKLNAELNELKNVETGTIQNELWLKNLMSLQGGSGRQLLKEEEIEKLKKSEPDFGMGELKINISTEPNHNGLINIEITTENNQDKNNCDEIHENKIQIEFDEIDENDQEGHQNDRENNLANSQEAVTQDINSQNETEMIELDIQTDSSNTIEHTNIEANEVTEENTNKSININAQNEITESYDDTSINNLNEEKTKDVINDKCKKRSKRKTNKKKNLLHKIEKSQTNCEQSGSSDMKKNTNPDEVNDSRTKKEINLKSCKFKEEHNQTNKSTKSDYNDSNESIELMDISKGSDQKVKIPKKMGKPKKGQKELNQPLRRSNRLSK